MATKVLAINSSPYGSRGNTAMILAPFLEGMKEAGAEVETYCTADLDIRPCRGDVACWMKAPGTCVLKDDMTWLAPKAIAADVLVMATPVYCDGMSSGMKTFLERLLPRGLPTIELRDGHTRHPHRLPAHGKLVLVSSCGLWEPDNFDPVVAHVRAYCRNADLEYTGALLRPHGLFLKRMLERGAPVKDVPEAAREAGRQLAREGTMSAGTLETVGRPLLSRDMFVQLFNEGVRARRTADEASKDQAPARDPGGKGPSQMAGIVALIRADESQKPEGERVCYDPYAIRFIDAGARELLLRRPAEFRAGMDEQNRRLPGLANAIVARARFVDDIVQSCLGAGLEQLVILGAGYDSRAYRIEGLKTVRVFEADQLATVAMKKEKVREIFGSLPDHVAYVPVDLGAENLARSLAAAGYDPAKKTLFVMEGLIYYLPPAAVDELFSFVARNSGAGSSVAFDYGRREAQGAAGGDFARQRGEPVLSWIDEPVETFLSRRGFALIRNLDSDDIRKAYFHGKNAGRAVSDRSHFAYAGVGLSSEGR